MRSSLVFAAAACWLTLVAPADGAADVVIANSRIRVRASVEENRLTITDLASGKTYVRNPCPAEWIERLERGRVSDPDWGEGPELRIRWANGWETSLFLAPDCPFVQIRTTVRNEGGEPFVCASLPAMFAQVDLGKPLDRLRSYGTGFLRDVSEPVTSFSFTALVDPLSRNGVVAAQLTHERSSGVFATRPTDQGLAAVECRLDFGRFQVDPGQARPTDTLLLGYFDDARLGLEAYADAVVKHYRIRLRPEPVVYCTWYHAGASDEATFAENVDFAAEHLKPFGLSVMQIDDGWQQLNSQPPPPGWDPNAPRGRGPVKEFVRANNKYPRGMAYTAKRTAARGLTPGVWFMPFAGDHHTAYYADKQDLFAHWPDGEPIEDKRWSGSLLDLSNPKTQAFVFARARRIYDWGYRYFKLDGLHTGAVTYNVYVNTDWRADKLCNSRNFIGQQGREARVDSNRPSTALADPRKTHIEAFRIGLDVLRRAAPDAFLLGCNVSQNMRSMGAAFGKLDAMRIGPDNGGGARGDWNGVIRGAKHGSNLYFLNDRIWRNDPDPAYVRPSNPLHYARLMVSWVAVTGSMLTVSEQFADLPPERLDLLKRAMPGHDFKPRPVDLFENEIPTTWLLTDPRADPPRYVIGLFNWKEREPLTIPYSLQRIGLDPSLRYVAFDYWAGRFVGDVAAALREPLPAGSCRVLAVRPAAERPLVLSTSRHITQGAVDVLEEQWDPQTETLSGRSGFVAGDPYELRVSLPAGGQWRLAEAEADGGAEAAVGEQSAAWARATIRPRRSGPGAWRLRFRRAAR